MQQLLTLVIIPGVFLPIIFSYIFSLTLRPEAGMVFIHDKVLVNIILLALVFGYGGVAMHAVSQILSDQFHIYGGPKEVIEINRFFHMTFSHNLTFAAAALVLLGITLLELNHEPNSTPIGIASGIIRGLLLGGAAALATYNYTRYTSGDVGRWNDFKVSFMVIWIGFVVLLYSIQQLNPKLTDYQLLLPSLLSFSVLIILSLVLVIRRVGKRWQVQVKPKALEQYLRGQDVD